MRHVNVSMLTIGIHSHRVIRAAVESVDGSRSKHQGNMLRWRPHVATAKSHVDGPREPTRGGAGGSRPGRPFHQAMRRKPLRHHTASYKSS